jgi:hypothetical protein
MRPYLEKSLHKKKKAGGLAQDVHTEIKPQKPTKKKEYPQCFFVLLVFTNNEILQDLQLLIRI